MKIIITKENMDDLWNLTNNTTILHCSKLNLITLPKLPESLIILDGYYYICDKSSFINNGVKRIRDRN